jgi:hypothetical protein
VARNSVRLQAIDTAREALSAIPRESGEHCVAGSRMLERPGAGSVSAHIGSLQLAPYFCFVDWHTQEIATH